jgi:hypothetical protein
MSRRGLADFQAWCGSLKNNNTVAFDGTLHHREKAHSRRREDYVRTVKQKKPSRYSGPVPAHRGTHQRLVEQGRRYDPRYSVKAGWQ